MASESPYYNELYSPIADDYAAEEARQTLIKAQKMKKKPKNNRKTKRTSRYDENMYALPELGGSNTALPGPPTTSSPPLPSSQKRCTEKRRITLLGIVIIALLILAFVTVLVYFSNSEKETLSLTTEPLGGSTTAFDSITHEVTTAPSQSSEVSVVFKVVGDSQIPTQWKQASLEDVKRYQNQARAVATEQWGGYCLTDGIFKGPGYNYQLTPHDPVPECGHYLLIKEYELVKRNMDCGEGTRYITSSSMPGCGGWDRMSLEDCKKKCSENEIPQGCMSNQNTSKICKYVIWDANQQHPPGWCQLADVECPVVDGGRTEMWRVLN